MDKKIAILRYFFEDPLKEFYIREIARKTKANHMTIRKYLNQFVKDSLLKKRRIDLYPTYSANTESKKYKNLKLFYNLEKIRESKIIENFEEIYEYPTIILFGSYAQATNTKESDIDLFMITNSKKDINTEKYEKIVERKINVVKVTPEECKKMKTKSPEFINNMCNGITLTGKWEVL